MPLSPSRSHHLSLVFACGHNRTDVVCDVKKPGTVDSKEPSEKSEGGGAGGEKDGGKEGASREQKQETEITEMSENKPSTETLKFAEPEAFTKPHGEKYTPKVRIKSGLLPLHYNADAFLAVGIL